MRWLLVITLFAIISIARGADAPVNDFTGHYELVKSLKTAFSLDVQQKGKSATISFSAGHVDGSGAAPDGDGKGALTDQGELKFNWTDSFENAGTATLKRNGKTFQLSMKSTKVVEPRALVLYDDHALKRTSPRPQTDSR
jgi:hypothetical protein